jgi:hypothetical protein
VAELRIDDDSVTVELSAAEKVECLHGDLVVPRSAVASARAVLDGMAEVHGLRAPGTGVPGMVLAGTFRDGGSRTFAVCHHRRPAVVLELDGQSFDRVVVTVEDPQAVVDRLG